MKYIFNICLMASFFMTEGQYYQYTTDVSIVLFFPNI